MSSGQSKSKFSENVVGTVLPRVGGTETFIALPRLEIFFSRAQWVCGNGLLTTYGRFTRTIAIFNSSLVLGRFGRSECSGRLVHARFLRLD
ncbi:hypothetical protein Pla22_36470 [Rubripirellula amarantea]|uniref:Uncharacterized protein n=1 Tax=Rubripirellula amarantea TaxID=2527999 RepID=A0A5C5WJB8_9BACT|nr:hypothetical protein Pla22_36470 [Rubripirellula amarantea]